MNILSESCSNNLTVGITGQEKMRVFPCLNFFPNILGPNHLTFSPYGKIDLEEDLELSAA